jgi:hypothetical protein
MQYLSDTYKATVNTYRETLVSWLKTLSSGGRVPPNNIATFETYIEEFLNGANMQIQMASAAQVSVARPSAAVTAQNPIPAETPPSKPVYGEDSIIYGEEQTSYGEQGPQYGEVEESVEPVEEGEAEEGGEQNTSKQEGGKRITKSRTKKNKRNSAAKASASGYMRKKHMQTPKAPSRKG